MTGLLEKLSDHPGDRLRTRTKLPATALFKLRRRLRKLRGKLPPGVNHVTMPDGSYAVVKDIGSRHVVASFLSPDMNPPGKDLRGLFSPNNPALKIGTRAAPRKQAVSSRPTAGSKPTTGENT